MNLTINVNSEEARLVSYPQSVRVDNIIGATVYFGDRDVTEDNHVGTLGRGDAVILKSEMWFIAHKDEIGIPTSATLSLTDPEPDHVTVGPFGLFARNNGKGWQLCARGPSGAVKALMTDKKD